MLNLSETGNIEIGDVSIPFTIVRSKRRRRTVAFTMDSPMTLRVIAPSRTTTSAINGIIRGHAAWIMRKFTELQKEGPPPAVSTFTTGGSIPYLGHRCLLTVIHNEAKAQGCVIKRRCFEVNIHDTDLSADVLRQEVRLEVVLWLKKRAKRKLKQRMDLWAKRMGLTYRQLIISNPDRRWGSCTSRNVIRLSWRLILAPLPLIDYVIVHELSHVVHKDHSVRFWKCVEHAMPDYEARLKKLREIGHHFVL